MICPTCEHEFAPPTEVAAQAVLPFCSLRCKQADLGRWLGERHAVPAKKSADTDEESYEEQAE
ncbi:MAG: DNA gyrase inhibitor YacG [Pirellulales bacterium]|nr:DNA gyrase inhibitor YacG [Pirellulales bacterium]